MKTNHALIYFLLFFNVASVYCMAQDTTASAPPAKHNAVHAETPDELLSQFALGSALGSDAYSVPKAAVKTYKFTALIGKGEWDFNLFNSVPVISINSADSEQYLRNDLVRQLGGIINVSMGRTGYFANGKNPEMEEIKGARFEFRIGGKLLDVVGGVSQERQLLPVGQSTIDFRYMIPLFKYEKNKEKVERTKDMAQGNLMFRFIGGAMGVMNSEIFDDYYSDRKGIPPNPVFFAGTFDVNFYITSQLFINFGYSFASEETIKPVPFFAISYGRTSQ
jgi:hypothetical protein